jgi:hypothetical protein
MNIKTLPMPKRCILVLNFRKRRIRAVAVAVSKPIKK